MISFLLQRLASGYRWLYTGLMLTLSACTLLQTPLQSVDRQQPKVFAHRAGSGFWPQNSREATKQLIKAIDSNQFQHVINGIEVDIVLTKDSIPVLSHDPWIHKTLCVHMDGSAVGEVLIKDMTFQYIKTHYQCGGIKDPEFPDASVFPEPIISLSEFIRLVNNHEALAIYLDLKIQDGLTMPAKDFAQAISSIWQQQNPRNQLYIEAPDIAAARAIKAYSQQRLTLLVSYPAFYANEDWNKVGALAGITGFIDPSKITSMVKEAGADGVSTPSVTLSDRKRDAILDINKQIFTFTPNDKDSMDSACVSGSNGLITDFPGQLGCQLVTQ